MMKDMPVHGRHTTVKTKSSTYHFYDAVVIPQTMVPLCSIMGLFSRPGEEPEYCTRPMRGTVVAVVPDTYKVEPVPGIEATRSLPSFFLSIGGGLFTYVLGQGVCGYEYREFMRRLVANRDGSSDEGKTSSPFYVILGLRNGFDLTSVVDEEYCLRVKVFPSNSEYTKYMMNLRLEAIPLLQRMDLDPSDYAYAFSTQTRHMPKYSWIYGLLRVLAKREANSPGNVKVGNVDSTVHGKCLIVHMIPDEILRYLFFTVMGEPVKWERTQWVQKHHRRSHVVKTWEGLDYNIPYLTDRRREVMYSIISGRPGESMDIRITTLGDGI
mmetsp:Transcript_39237/g.103844  ORF Transcript_39237/g.103844 Transcript_39237/m.103844 type:complete len:324 (+) Transcript_39237:1774-2745(+)